jgi:hypothetical protein
LIWSYLWLEDEMTRVDSQDFVVYRDQVDWHKCTCGCKISWRSRLTCVYLSLQDKVTEWTEIFTCFCWIRWLSGLRCLPVFCRIRWLSGHMFTCCCRIRWLSGLRCLPVVAGKGDWVDWDVYLFLQDKVTEWTDVYLLLQDKVTEWTEMVTCCCRIRWLSELRCVPVVAG